MSLIINMQNQKAPKVSVVVPSYNHAQFLTARMRSVLSQTFSDIEVLVLDDASTDSSLEILGEFEQEPRVRIVPASFNSGSPFKQWNTGVRMSRGEYVWIAESDDFAAPELLEVLVEILDSHQDVGLAYCQSWEVDEFSRAFQLGSTYCDLFPKSRWLNDYFNSGKDECRRFLSLRNTIPNASAVLFRKALYDSAGCADESLFLCGDWLMWIRMLQLSNIAFVARPLNYWRCAHRASVRGMTRRKQQRYEEMAHVMKEALSSIDDPARRHAAAYELVRSWMYDVIDGRSWELLRMFRRICVLAQGLDSQAWLSFVRCAVCGLCWVMRSFLDGISRKVRPEV